ncbi:MAG TPA: glycosyltransferase family 2 protein [Pirellulaceae bacterium]|nr:glycosyltransferase family 2 protein [Pirellulaceae bacterium]
MLWGSLGAVVYAYAIYPLLIYLLARAWGRQILAPQLNEDELPPVSLLIAALNEEKWIADRVLNALHQDYPAGRLRVVVASDGSTDRTCQIVRDLADRYPGRVVLFDFPVRRGKATVLNSALPKLSTEFVVLSDANTFFERSAVRNLVRWFRNPEVAAVCGKLNLVDAATGRNVDGVYWRYENFLKGREALLGALLGANGAVYAIRRRDYVAIPGDTIIDDFVIPLQIKLRTRGRIVYDAAAVATEETPPHVSDEFRRRARIGAGGFQSAVRLWPLVLPTIGWTSLAFVSHKLLRWCAPLFLLLALAANVLLLYRPEYQLLFAMQAGFYALAAVGALVPGNSAAIRGLRLTTLFASMNAALAVGFWRWLAGWQQGTWQRTAR